MIEREQEYITNTEHSETSIFLVGMMGAGKTTIGRALAKSLGQEFIDLDVVLESRCGVKIPIIFEIEGEDGFRRRETSVLEDISLKRGIVLATGGGAILAQQNREILKKRGTVIYLRACAEELYRRVAKDKNRPLLATENPKQRIIDLLKIRESLYEEIADITVDTGGHSINGAVDLIQELIAKKSI